MVLHNSTLQPNEHSSICAHAPIMGATSHWSHKKNAFSLFIESTYLISLFNTLGCYLFLLFLVQFKDEHNV